MTITAAGATGVVWTAHVLGLTATYTVQGGDTATLVATGLNAAIDALAGVQSHRTGAAMTVVYQSDGVNDFVLSNDGAGTFTDVAFTEGAHTRTAVPASGTVGRQVVKQSVP